MTWRALFARLWHVIVQRFTPLAPCCVECGFPVERIPLRPLLTRWECVKWFVRRGKISWGDNLGHCLECAQLIEEAARVQFQANIAAELLSLREEKAAVGLEKSSAKMTRAFVERHGAFMLPPGYIAMTRNPANDTVWLERADGLTIEMEPGAIIPVPGPRWPSTGFWLDGNTRSRIIAHGLIE